MKNVRYIIVITRNIIGAKRETNLAITFLRAFSHTQLAKNALETTSQVPNPLKRVNPTNPDLLYNAFF